MDTDEGLVAKDLNDTFTEVESAVTDNANGITSLGVSKQNTLNIITVVKTATVRDSSSGCAVEYCPTTHPMAISGGGTQTSAVLIITESVPRLSRTTTVTSLPDGVHGPAIGWQVCALNNTTALATLKVAVICANL